MTDEAAKRQLRRMLKHFTVGSVLHPLGEIFEEDAQEARQDGDETRYEQCRTVASALFVVGLGIDAACPR
jgi:hypothetical protein